MGIGSLFQNVAKNQARDAAQGAAKEFYNTADFDEDGVLDKDQIGVAAHLVETGFKGFAACVNSPEASKDLEEAFKSSFKLAGAFDIEQALKLRASKGDKFSVQDLLSTVHPILFLDALAEIKANGDKLQGAIDFEKAQPSIAQMHDGFTRFGKYLQGVQAHVTKMVTEAEAEAAAALKHKK